MFHIRDFPQPAGGPWPPVYIEWGTEVYWSSVFSDGSWENSGFLLCLRGPLLSVSVGVFPFGLFFPSISSIGDFDLDVLGWERVW